MLYESLFALLHFSPWYAFALPLWALRGRAHLKHEIARRVRLDPASLPYRTELLDFLRAEQASGRSLVLVSAADQEIVRAIADHLRLFSEVIASDGRRNLKGAQKAAALRARFGSRGYDYVGDSGADVAVWNDARQAIVVNASSRVLKRLQTPVTRTFPERERPRWVVVRAMRVEQWVKNLLVFVPLLMAPEVRNVRLFGSAALAFVSFSLCASAVYLGNDLFDLAADRSHARKRHRPFAAGEMSIATGLVLALLCVAAAVALASPLPRAFLGMLVLYVTVTTAYSVRLKHVALLDVIVLAMLYTGRVLAGSAATNVWPSPWLLAFSMFFFLSLAFVKRFSELLALRRDNETALKVRGYYASDLEQIASHGAASGYISVLVAALYINSERVVGLYSRPTLLWLVCPLLLYWISRVWLLAHRGQMHDDPVVFAVRDRVSYVIGAIMAAVLVLARIAGP